ncbi:MAG: triose-phosphate isomerase [Gemmatimonadota bacterium]
MSDVQTPVYAANWKMHKGPSATRTFVRSFRDRYVVFFPPSISVPAFREDAEGRPDIGLGVQDVHHEREGAHTSAISAPMASDAGAGWGLAGHSERRREFGDSDETVAAKLARLAEEGIRPVLCVGETLEEREAGRLREVLSRQVRRGLAEVDDATRREVVFAYEPVWAIGTGETAAPEDAGEAHGIVREAVRESTDPATAERAVILYGGSVKPHNARELLGTPGLDGVLVGSASLEPESFAEICRALD